MLRRPPRSTRTDTLFPYTTLFRSVVGHADGVHAGCQLRIVGHGLDLPAVHEDPRRIAPQTLAEIRSRHHHGSASRLTGSCFDRLSMRSLRQYDSLILSLSKGEVLRSIEAERRVEIVEIGRGVEFHDRKLGRTSVREREVR